MAPVGLLTRIHDMYTKLRGKQDPPLLASSTAALLSIIFTLIYVLPFYISSTTRPSPTLNRDAPSVIKARIRAVTVACVIASLTTTYILVNEAKADVFEVLHLLGWWPIQLKDLATSFIATLLLYLGPLFEKLVVENELQHFRRGAKVIESLSSWQGYRNYVAGPVTEEVIFRSVMIPLHLLAKVSPTWIVFLTPLYFGIAHVHHFYEFRLTHPHTPLVPALLRTIFQFAYTTIFGWYASFLYVRTGSIYICILVHAFCNWYGLPRFWGRLRRPERYGPAPVPLRGKDDVDATNTHHDSGELGLGWTVVYYILLFVGAYAFYALLWPLTESTQALAHFGGSSRSSR